MYVILAFFTHIFAWVALVIMGRYPQWLYKFNSGVVRYMVRFYAWAYLQTDVWPPFGISDDQSYPVRVNVAPAAERQSRLKVFFRLLLALPMLLVSYGVQYMRLGAIVVAWLTIVFRGYLPEGVNTAFTFANSFEARVLGYVAMLTDETAEKAIISDGTGFVPAMSQYLDQYRTSTSQYAAFTDAVLGDGRTLDYPLKTTEFGNALVTGFQQLVAKPSGSGVKDLLTSLQSQYGQAG